MRYKIGELVDVELRCLQVAQTGNRWTRFSNDANSVSVVIDEDAANAVVRPHPAAEPPSGAAEFATLLENVAAFLRLGGHGRPPHHAASSSQRGATGRCLNLACPETEIAQIWETDRLPHSNPPLRIRICRPCLVALVHAVDNQ